VAGRRKQLIRLPLARIGIMAAIGLALALSGRSTASAHASYVSSNPTDKQVLAKAPAQLTITFASNIAADPGTFAAVTGNGKDAAMGWGGVSQTDSKTLVVPLQSNLPDGKYSVFWKSTDADDGGITFGRFSFFVGNPNPSDLSTAQAGASIAVPDAATARSLDPFGTTGNSCTASDTWCNYCQSHPDSSLCPKSGNSMGGMMP
jgi:methionine-rich copper-binding protein CopC